MTRRSTAVSLALILAPCLLAALPHAAPAGECGHCPTTIFCRPKPPRIKYQSVCPKPICCPCDIQHFGYFPTCWRAWPFGDPHCAASPTPAPLMLPPSGPSSPARPAGEPLPAPQPSSPKVTLLLPDVP